MKKQEVTYFKNHYIDYLKINNRNSDICVWLENAVDFEGPDGYYFDSSMQPFTMKVITPTFISSAIRLAKNHISPKKVLKK